MVVNCAVVGDPIDHSLSEVLHRAAYTVLDIPWNYQKIRVPQGNLQQFLDTLDTSWRGLSVTMPLKSEALSIASTSDLASNQARGSNTLVFEYDEHGKRQVHAYNTDVRGLTHALVHTGWAFTEPSWILGGGATARSALLAIADLGIGEVNVLVRNVERANGLKSVAEQCGIRLNFVTPEHLQNDTGLRMNGLVVNTLPSSASIQEMGLVQAKFHDQTRLYEVAYDHWPSELAQTVMAQEGAVVSGITMLIEQAVLQLRLFLNGDMEQALPRELEILVAMRSSVPIP